MSLIVVSKLLPPLLPPQMRRRLWFCSIHNDDGVTLTKKVHGAVALHSDVDAAAATVAAIFAWIFCQCAKTTSIERELKQLFELLLSGCDFIRPIERPVAEQSAGPVHNCVNHDLVSFIAQATAEMNKFCSPCCRQY